MPHVYGVSYFSSKGPTGDGRLKPDIVAPGEKIISCATGNLKAEGAKGRECDYVETSGTSMAAPHVSGVIAAFLSIRGEFIGRAERVKDLFVSSATDLRRDRYFQGAGLVRSDAGHPVRVTRLARRRATVADIAGIPYFEAEFDKNGQLRNAVTLPAPVTDLLLMSHGWNNSADDARTLYRNFFTNFVAVGKPGELAGRSFAIIGVIWPSKKFDELIAAADPSGSAEGSAGLGSSAPASRVALDAKLRSDEGPVHLAGAAADPREDARALLPDLEEKASARRAFVDKIRSLLDRSAANKEDASITFFKDDGDELMKNLKIAGEDLDPEVGAASSNNASLPLGIGGTVTATDGAAGLKDALSGFLASAMNVLNFTTYYEMKARAGAVGKDGVAKLIDDLAPGVQRIHLIGHSFGGRVVTATAAGSTTNKIRSLSLLQTAFSHNGFSKQMNGFFRSVVDTKRVDGPIVVTHTANDKAVGVAYPLASRINGDKTAAFGDKDDVFGGLGRNGAQQMESGETISGNLLAVGAAYKFKGGTFFNLEASEFIKSHGDVAGREVAFAVRQAIS